MQDKYVAILLSVFDLKQHTRRYSRMIYEYLPGKPFSEWTIGGAIQHGHFHIFLHLYQKEGYVNSLNRPISDYWPLYEEAGKYGRMDVIQFLDQQGHQASGYTLSLAAFNNHVEVIKYLLINGYKLVSMWTVNDCIENERIEILKLFRAHGIDCYNELVNIQQLISEDKYYALEFLLTYYKQEAFPKKRWRQYGDQALTERILIWLFGERAKIISLFRKHGIIQSEDMDDGNLSGYV